MRYSQNDEQDMLFKFFEEYKRDHVKRLLDVGAFDGVTFSNSKAFIDNGWDGVLVEPDPFNVIKIIGNDPKNVTVICAAVGPSSGISDLVIERYPDRGWATSIHYKRDSGRILFPLSGISISVPVITMSQLLAWGPFSFISIDAEGMDYEIMKTIPDSMLAECAIISIEPKDMSEREQMKTWFSSKGWKIYHETPENLLVTPWTTTP